MEMSVLQQYQVKAKRLTAIVCLVMMAIGGLMWLRLPSDFLGYALHTTIGLAAIGIIASFWGPNDPTKEWKMSVIILRTLFEAIAWAVVGVGIIKLLVAGMENLEHGRFLLLIVILAWWGFGITPIFRRRNHMNALESMATFLVFYILFPVGVCVAIFGDMTKIMMMPLLLFACIPLLRTQIENVSLVNRVWLEKHQVIFSHGGSEGLSQEGEDIQYDFEGHTKVAFLFTLVVSYLALSVVLFR